MSFRYYALFRGEESEEPSGLMAVNRDKEAERLDMILFNRISGRWESDPDAVGLFLFGDDYMDRRVEVARRRAEEIAATLATVVPSEEEMMRISDEAERRRGPGRTRV